MYHASRFCVPGRRTPSIRPSGSVVSTRCDKNRHHQTHRSVNQPFPADLGDGCRERVRRMGKYYSLSKPLVAIFIPSSAPSIGQPTTENYKRSRV
jgi:hypothetical protein